MLEERLTPVLLQLRAEESEREARIDLVKRWFRVHNENFATDVADLTFLCALPDSERTLLTYPVIGNWFFEKVQDFAPASEKQNGMHVLVKKLILEQRFNNNHFKDSYESPEEYNRVNDVLHSAMLRNPAEGLPLCELMAGIYNEIGETVHRGGLPRKDTYSIDLGHGLSGPANHFSYITEQFRTAHRWNLLDPLDLTIMIVDDQDPVSWYQRMISIGFKEQRQQGFFWDCESALQALESRRYDVVLSDLDLGEGKMDGIEFAQRAYAIQQANGITPRISVFSYSDARLEEANRRIGNFAKKPENKKLFHQVTYSNNKTFFTAMNFRSAVISDLLRR